MSEYSAIWKADRISLPGGDQRRLVPLGGGIVFTVSNPVIGKGEATEALPLRDRFPDYLMIFGAGWLGITVVGVAIGIFSTASLVEGISYAALGYGVFMLLAGGASGGGYTNLGLGAAGALFGGAHRQDEDFDDPDVRRGRSRRVNARERLNKGLRPERNPRAFWQVIAGFCYLAGAILLLELFTG